MAISGHMQKPSCEVAGNLHIVTFSSSFSSQYEGQIMIQIGGIFKNKIVKI